MSDDEKVKYVLELDVPGLVKGEGVEIPGLGVFDNGSTYDITQEEAERYRDMHSTVEYDTNAEGVNTESRVVRGKTLLQHSKGMMGVTVSTASSDDDDDDEEDEVKGQQLVESSGQTLDDEVDDELDLEDDDEGSDS